MCACEPGFTCGRCEARRAVDVGEWSEREIELWRQNEDASRVEFEQPMEGKP